MLTIEQCRGARGLLGWTQQDLADASGLSKTAINNFEKGHSDIKSESLRAIRLAFESADIEFLTQNGIRKRAESLRIFRGPGAMTELLMDIQDTLKSHTGASIFISHVDSRLPGLISTQALFDHIEFVKNNGIVQRVLSAHGSQNLLSPQDDCRWIGPEITGAAKPTFIYGSKIAFALWDQTIILVITSQEASDAERKRFESLWIRAAIPSHNAAVRKSQQ